ncbi:MAG TPA: CGNR zinc finger domain-containing protein [Candidatus Saccharimonadales bacterium]|nr:CGNR zinc finger domain-containing protein [Candidatus Saccharimonadales bacterium]
MEKATEESIDLGSATYAAKRAADVVAVLQNKDRLEYQAVLAKLNETLKMYGERSAVTTANLDELKAVGRRLYEVFETHNTNEAVTLLNDVLKEYGSQPRLTAHDGSAWHLHVDSSDHAPWAEWFAASSALALATLLAEKQRNPGGLCASPTCSKPFIDLGKGGGRNYCSPKCATRERVAKYRAKDSIER